MVVWGMIRRMYRKDVREVCLVFWFYTEDGFGSGDLCYAVI